MKANGSYASATSDQGRRAHHQKLLFIPLIIALMLASLPVASVFAAPPLEQNSAAVKNWEQAWRNKLRQLRGEISFYNRFQFEPGKIKDAAKRERAQQALDKYRAALSQAQAIVASHSGFDSEGQILNERRAKRSVENLTENLRIMRAMTNVTSSKTPQLA